MSCALHFTLVLCNCLIPQCSQLTDSGHSLSAYLSSLLVRFLSFIMSDVHLNLHIVKFFVLTLFNLVLFLLYINLNSLAETFHCKYLVAKTSSNLA